MELKWQPIESAPKDGTNVLGWDGYEVMVISFGDNCRRVRQQPGDMMWSTPRLGDNNRGECNEPFEPTHWMPLPDPPEASK